MAERDTYITKIPLYIFLSIINFVG